MAAIRNSEMTQPYSSDIDGWPFGIQGWAGVEMHEGFLEFVLSVWPEVRSAVRSLYASRARPIWVTGHSLGGAASMIFSAMLRDDFARSDLDPPLHVVTFGSPKIGDQDWVDKYERDADLAHRTERWVNHRDLIVESPIRSAYEHAGRRLHVDHASCSARNPSCWTLEYDAPEYDIDANITDIQYHALENYLNVFDWNVPQQLESILDRRCVHPG